jgi:hypothetical protein
LSKRLWLTILLAILIWGVGHVYLGHVKQGITILIIGIVVAFVMPWFIPYPWSWIIPIGFWVWQIFDGYKHYDKLNSTNSN